VDRKNREKLYQQLDDNEDVSDKEKREAYFAEIANQEAEERWQNEQ
jgi:hypothetical protein